MQEAVKQESTVSARRIHQILTNVTTAVKLESSMDRLRDVFSVVVYGIVPQNVRKDTGLKTRCCAKQ